LGHDVSLEANVQVWVIFVKVHLELVVRQFVTGLKLSVVFSSLLHSIIGEVYKTVGKIVDAILSTRGPQVAFLVHEHFSVAID
jgi:hypothetical protein